MKQRTRKGDLFQFLTGLIFLHRILWTCFYSRASFWTTVTLYQTIHIVAILSVISFYPQFQFQMPYLNLGKQPRFFFFHLSFVSIYLTQNSKTFQNNTFPYMQIEVHLKLISFNMFIQLQFYNSFKYFVHIRCRVYRSHFRSFNCAFNFWNGSYYCKTVYLNTDGHMSSHNDSLNKLTTVFE